MSRILSSVCLAYSTTCAFQKLVAVDGNAPPLKASKAPGPTFIRNGINQNQNKTRLAIHLLCLEPPRRLTILSIDCSYESLKMAETRGFEPLDDITIIGYLVGSYFKPDSVMFPIFKFTFQRTTCCLSTCNKNIIHLILRKLTKIFFNPK